MFGRQARPITGIGRPVDLIPDTYLDNFSKNLNSIWARARANIIQAKTKSAERENDKISRQKIEEFKIGEKVLVQTEVFKGRVNRTEPAWMGPYRIVKVNDSTLLVAKRNRTVLINKGRCKPFVEGN